MTWDAEMTASPGGVRILGSGGGAPSGVRETACYLIRDGGRALLVDVGTGARRLFGDPRLLDGVDELDIVLTHFHLDHVCGLPYLLSLAVDATIWAPGRWLYDRDAARILEPLRRPPIAPSDQTEIFPVRELREGAQEIGGFRVRASAQPRHWAPSAGLRIDDQLALITDTPYEPSSSALADGVPLLLHEAWSASSEPLYPEHDATGADAARVAREAGVERLVLIHLSPHLADHTPILADAAASFARVELGTDDALLITT
jgi:ribonuclease BN (tRNA processing enzyme)